MFDYKDIYVLFKCIILIHVDYISLFSVAVTKYQTLYS